MDNVPPYRLGFAVKVLGDGGLKSHDARRWRSGPHLSRSLELLEAVFDYLDGNDLRVYRMSSATIPYGTHPALPHLDYRRQLDECGEALAILRAQVRRLGLRLSTHPGQYTVVNSPDPEIAHKALLDLEQDTALLDELGAGPEAVVVVHVGGVYGDKSAAIERFARAWQRLSERARARVAIENDEACFDVADVLELHRRLGLRVVFDWHHHRCNPAPTLADPAEALAAAYATWPASVRPKIHLSSPRTALDAKGRPPKLDQHADFVTPWDLLDVLHAAPGPVDVMLEAKAKDLAVLWLRRLLRQKFDTAPDGYARTDRNGYTDVEVSIDYEPPAGTAGEAPARIFENPEQQVEDALARFSEIVRGW